MNDEEVQRLKELLWSPDEARRKQGVELLRALEQQGVLEGWGSLQWYLRRHCLIEWCEEVYAAGSIQSPLPRVLRTDLRYWNASLGGALVQDPFSNSNWAQNGARFHQAPERVVLWKKYRRHLGVIFRRTTAEGLLGSPEVRFFEV